MRRLFTLVFGMLLGGVTMYSAFQFHLVRADKGFFFVRKKPPSLVDPYVDIRTWRHREWQAHPAVAEALVRNGRADLVTSSHHEGILRELFPRIWKSGQE